MSMRFIRRVPVMFIVSLIILGTVIAARVLVNQPPAAQSELDEPAVMFTQTGAEEVIARLQERLRDHPQDAAAYAQLGWALLQRVRETGDASLYGKAESALDEALKRDAHSLDALTGKGSLALSRHQFAEAIRWGEQARAINPYRAQIYGIIADGQTELGRYDEAIATLQKMVDTRPDLNSYSRVSYARELHGDVPGAINAMEMAIAAGDPRAEGTLWTQVQLGNLYFNSGDLARAEATYQRALQVKPDYVYAQAGLGRVRAGQGRYAEAIELYRGAAARLPMPEFVIALGELYEVTGQAAAANQQYDLVRAIQQLYRGGGVDVDMELALFNSDHGGDPSQAVAQARAAFSHRPTIYAADALAWALYQAGHFTEARGYYRQALRLGTRDALLHYHAAMIERALGKTAAATSHLQEALAINPAFSIRYAPKAHALLSELSR